MSPFSGSWSTREPSLWVREKNIDLDTENDSLNGLSLKANMKLLTDARNLKGTLVAANKLLFHRGLFWQVISPPPDY